VVAKLSHLGKGGEARMVDVSAKAPTERVAVAEGRVVMAAKTLDLVLAGNAKKGDVLGAAAPPASWPPSNVTSQSTPPQTMGR
jgi:molybdenum cofactor biosynthesis enzyme